MINREATIRWKGYDPDDLSSGSGKRVWANCDECGKGRWMKMQDYNRNSGLCNRCARSGVNNGMFGKKHHSETLAKIVKSANERSPESIAAMAKTKTGVPLSPETCAAMSKASLGVPKSPEHCAAIKKGRENSDAVKAQYESMRGGNDICKHHFIYDHNHPENHTIEITRAEHASHHAWMQRNGLEVPHINTQEVF